MVAADPSLEPVDGYWWTRSPENGSPIRKASRECARWLDHPKGDPVVLEYRRGVVAPVHDDPDRAFELDDASRVKLEALASRLGATLVVEELVDDDEEDEAPEPGPEARAPAPQPGARTDRQGSPRWRVVAQRLGLPLREPLSARDLVGIGRRLRDSEDDDRNRFEGTLSAFQEALARDPGLAEARLAVARTLVDRGELDRALDCLRPLLEGPEPSREAQGLRETVERARADLEPALRGAEERRADSAGDPDAHKEAGRVYAGAQRWPKCLESFRQAAALAPGDSDAHFGVATALVFLGRSEEARAALERWRRLDGGTSLLELVPDPTPVYEAVAAVRGARRRGG